MANKEVGVMAFAVALIVFGVITVAEVLVYLYTKRQYRLHPEREKSYSFELLAIVYRSRRATVMALVISLLCIVGGIILLIKC